MNTKKKIRPELTIQKKKKKKNEEEEEEEENTSRALNVVDAGSQIQNLFELIFYVKIDRLSCITKFRPFFFISLANLAHSNLIQKYFKQIFHLHSMYFIIILLRINIFSSTTTSHLPLCYGLIVSISIKLILTTHKLKCFSFLFGFVLKLRLDGRRNVDKQRITT